MLNKDYREGIKYYGSLEMFQFSQLCWSLTYDELNQLEEELTNYINIHEDSKNAVESSLNISKLKLKIVQDSLYFEDLIACYEHPFSMVNRKSKHRKRRKENVREDKHLERIHGFLYTSYYTPVTKVKSKHGKTYFKKEHIQRKSHKKLSNRAVRNYRNHMLENGNAYKKVYDYNYYIY